MKIEGENVHFTAWYSIDGYLLYVIQNLDNKNIKIYRDPNIIYSKQTCPNW